MTRFNFKSLALTGGLLSVAVILVAIVLLGNSPTEAALANSADQTGPKPTPTAVSAGPTQRRTADKPLPTRNQAQQASAAQAPWPLPILIPADDEGYILQQAGKPIVAPDGRQVAKLINIPAELSQSVEVRLPKLVALDEAQVGFALTSIVRYKGNGHSLYVTMTKPTNAALTKNLGLGSQEVVLANGEKWWYSGNIPGAVSGQFITRRGNLLITLASDLSMDKLQALAENLIVG